jgi:hypothetical protein
MRSVRAERISNTPTKLPVAHLQKAHERLGKNTGVGPSHSRGDTKTATRSAANATHTAHASRSYVHLIRPHLVNMAFNTALAHRADDQTHRKGSNPAQSISSAHTLGARLQESSAALIHLRCDRVAPRGDVAQRRRVSRHRLDGHISGDL